MDALQGEGSDPPRHPEGGKLRGGIHEDPDATGVHDIDELVNKFIEAEDANFSQLTHVQQLSKELERVEMQVTETQQDIQRYKSQGSSSDDQRLKILKMIDDQLRTGQRQSTERRLKESREHAQRLKTGACQLFNEIGCENSFEVAGLGHTSKRSSWRAWRT